MNDKAPDDDDKVLDDDILALVAARLVDIETHTKWLEDFVGPLILDKFTADPNSSFKDAMVEIDHLQNVKSMLGVLKKLMAGMSNGETGARLQKVHDAQKAKEKMQ